MSGLDSLPDRPDWWDAAACRTSHPDVFFPVDAEGVVRAQRICDGCPDDAKAKCLEGALERREDAGVWGGKSERQRRQLLRHFRRPRPPTPPTEERTAS